jgi:ubiquinone biosynthesis protein UbiJ
MDFLERMKQALDKSVEASKDFFGKAGETAKDLSAKGVLRLEIRELEGRAKKELSKLGHVVYEQFAVHEKASVTAKNQEVSAIIDEISHIKDEIQKREEKLNEDKDAKEPEAE